MNSFLQIKLFTKENWKYTKKKFFGKGKWEEKKIELKYQELIIEGEKDPLEINETTCITYPKEHNSFQIRNEEDEILLIAQSSNNEYREEWMYWINKVIAFDREKYEKTQSYRKLKEETKKSKTEEEIKELKNNKENVPNSNKNEKEEESEDEEKPKKN